MLRSLVGSEMCIRDSSWATTSDQLFEYPTGITQAETSCNLQGLRLTLSFALLTRISFFLVSGILRGCKMAESLEHLQSTITRQIQSSLREVHANAANNPLRALDPLRAVHRFPACVNLDMQDAIISIVAAENSTEGGLQGSAHLFETMDFAIGSHLNLELGPRGGEDKADVGLTLGAQCSSKFRDVHEPIVEPFSVSLQFVRAQDCGPERWTLLNSCMANLSELKMSLPAHMVCFVEDALTLHHAKLLKDETVGLIKEAFPSELLAICKVFKFQLPDTPSHEPVIEIAPENEEMLDPFVARLDRIEVALQRASTANERSSENVNSEREAKTELLSNIEDRLEEAQIQLHYSRNGMTPNIYNHRVILAQGAAAAIKNQGYLKMQAGMHIHQMKKRWFILRGNEMLYLRDTSSTVPLGHIQLQGAIVSDCQPVLGTSRDHALCFQLIWSDVTILLQAPSIEEKSCWIAELMTAISLQESGFCGFLTEERSQKQCYFELGARNLTTYSEPNGAAQGSLHLHEGMTVTSSDTQELAFKIRDESRFCLTLVAQDAEQKQRWMEAVSLSIRGPRGGMHGNTRLRSGSLMRSGAHESQIGNMQQVQLHVVGHQTVKDSYTLYTIQVTHSTFSWPVYRRFSEFVSLHRQLTKEHHQSIASLSPNSVAAFKTRQLFGSLHADLVHQRQILLQEYIQAISSDSALRNSSCFYSFFSLQNLAELDPQGAPAEHVHGGLAKAGIQVHMKHTGTVSVIECAPALFGGVNGTPTVFPYDIAGRLVLANPPYADLALSRVDGSERSLWDGAVVVVLRGLVTFGVKARHVQDAGAAAMIVVNEEGGVKVSMELTAAENGARSEYTMPSVAIEWEDWLRFRSELPTKCCVTSADRAMLGFDPDRPDQLLSTLSPAQTGEDMGISVQADEIEAEAVDLHLNYALANFMKLREECDTLIQQKDIFEQENQHLQADSAMQQSTFNAQMNRMDAEVKAVREQNQQLLEQVRDHRELKSRLDELEAQLHVSEASREAAENELALKKTLGNKMKEAFSLGGSKKDKALQDLANQLMQQISEKDSQLEHARQEKKIWASKLGELQIELEQVTNERDELLLDADDGQSESTWTTQRSLPQNTSPHHPYHR
eukprot:TRINITY_DN20299_c0_g7_i2.p1 TRINITY_DN20299_c0_g7~~TRINITY_DN20299_c0_g7_i2.p1  ORF type:complete len:1141 (+),score=251.54 TRINITY_DN20299_c0_g7_i2:46-3423(+)